MTHTTTDAAEARATETFLAQLRRVSNDRYTAWVTSTVPLMLCEHCGRFENEARDAGVKTCSPPFTVQEHIFTRPHPYLTQDVNTDAGIMFDALELGGEVGELLNVVKKLEREDRGWRGSRAAPDDFADECADVLICLDKLARRRGVDLEAATVAKFNATSEKVGLPHRLATAEAASGAGEREEWAFTPDTREAQAIAQLSEEQELSPQAVMRQALRLYQANFLRRKAGETVTWSGDEQRAREFAGLLASLPPATDPAIEECARIASLELAAALANIEVGYRPAHNEGAREAAERIERRIRALAAAPTIPATGHAATEGEG